MKDMFSFVGTMCLLVFGICFTCLAFFSSVYFIIHFFGGK